MASGAAAEKTLASRPGRRERERFVAFAFCWADLLIEVSSTGQVEFAGGAVDVLLGMSASEVRGLPLGEIVAVDNRRLLEELLKVARHNGRITNARVRLFGRRGATMPLSMAGYSLDEMGGHTFLAFRVRHPVVSHDQDGLPRDEVSGLFSDDGFTQMALGRMKGMRAANEDVSVTLLTLPDYAMLRRRLDRAAEEDLIHTLSACLKANSISGDSAGRLANDRYGLVHDRRTDIRRLDAQIDDVTRRADPQGLGAGARSATIDVDHRNLPDEDVAKGLVSAIEDFRESANPVDVLERMPPRMSEVVTRVEGTLSAFKEMVSARAFDVAFQPIINAHSGVIHHYEALARFDLGDGEISPAHWIARAEEAGLITEFDMAMLERMVTWLAKSWATQRYHVALNMSGHSLESGDFVNEMLNLLRANNWLRGHLMFEITETKEISDLLVANRYIQGMRTQGYMVCLDDFGAGAADFQYLSSLEVDLVKFDGGALRQAQKGGKGRAFLRALTALCSELEIECVAEMIDSKRGLDFIRDCGVHYAQGYLFGRPSLDIDSFTRTDISYLFPRR